MPELPEVAYQKMYLDATSLYQKIVKVETGANKIFQSPKTEFEEALLNNEITSVNQLGKYLLLELKNAPYLVIHFGMTGRMDYFKHDELHRHAHLTLTFENNAKLSFICPRKFGKLFLTNSLERFKKDQNLGAHASSLSENDFQKLFENKKGGIKTALMDQSFIAGLGNLYVDETLFHSGIHPNSKIENLQEADIKKMYRNMIMVLGAVTANKTEGKELPDSFLRPHRQKGVDCPTGKGKVDMIKVGGRSTYFCPECQKMQ